MSVVTVFNKEFELDFLSGWIKYARSKKGYSQEYLSKGVCSKSHLSYFENGKKGLRGEIIELLLKKLDVKAQDIKLSIGKLRKKFLDMAFAIEFSNKEDAKQIYNEFLAVEDMMQYSPYHMEYRIYMMYYEFLVAKLGFETLKDEFALIDQVKESLEDELRHYYLFLTGKAYYKFVDHKEGILRLQESLAIKDTPQTNYHLGFSYSFDDQPMRGKFYLEKALDSYTKSGRYINALWCHNNIGICYAHLGMFDDAIKSFEAALNGGTYFEDNLILDHVNINMADAYLKQGKFKESLIWTKKSLNSSYDLVLSAVNLVEAYRGLGDQEALDQVFTTYRVEDNKNSKYYPLLEFYYLLTYCIEEDYFEERVLKEILPFYKSMNYINLCDYIRKGLISYYEKKRRYKDANKLYRELLRYPAK